MSKKAFVIILILSVVVTYGTSIIDSLINNTLLAGESGFPLKYSKATLFGKGNIDGVMLILDITFWFFVLFISWKLILKFFKR